VLHIDFEWVALYRSYEHMRTDVARSVLIAPWVSLGTLWPNEPFWLTSSSSISNRSTVVEGTFDVVSGGHMGMFSGAIQDVKRPSADGRRSGALSMAVANRLQRELLGSKPGSGRAVRARLVAR